MVRFEDDPQFLTWRRDSPDGLVVNMRHRASSDYFVLDRASCSSLDASDNHRDGAFTKRGYEKWGAAKAEEFLPAMGGRRRR